MISTKQKYILSILPLDEKVDRMKFIKIFFLISKDSFTKKRIKFYHFIPYQYGPFSYELYRDLSKLESQELIEMDDNTITLKKKPNLKLQYSVEMFMKRYWNEYSNYSTQKIVNKVYKDYPFYTIFSKLKKREKYERDQIGITNIGYEGKTIDEFLFELLTNKITLLVDVRINPFSMKFDFNKKKLKTKLESIGIKYLHIPELGIPSESRKNLKNDKDYQILFHNYTLYLETKKVELNRITKLARTEKIAMMCFEKDPNYCHRGIISKRFRERGLEVIDI